MVNARIAWGDLKNTPLKKIDLKPYCLVRVFVSAGPHQLVLTSDVPRPRSVVKRQDRPGPKNQRPSHNLDTHLAYYWGVYEMFQPSEITFVVVSSDWGFSALMAHLVAHGRGCVQIGWGA